MSLSNEEIRKLIEAVSKAYEEAGREVTKVEMVAETGNLIEIEADTSKLN